MKNLKRTVHREPASITLESYLAGLVGVDLNTVLVAGEDLVNHVMRISIHDLPGWIKAGAHFDLRMSKDDKRLLKAYFRKLKLDKRSSPDLSEEIQSWGEKRIQRANHLGQRQMVNLMKRKRITSCRHNTFDAGEALPHAREVDYNQAINDLMAEARRLKLE